jgi:hypothetical protein
LGAIEMEINPIINCVGILNHFTNHTKGSIKKSKKATNKNARLLSKTKKR